MQLSPAACPKRDLPQARQPARLTRPRLQPRQQQPRLHHHVYSRDGQTASAAANTSASQSTEVASSAASDDGGVETASFIAIEDDPLIIDASSVVDGDGVGSMQVQWQISEDGSVWSNLSGEIRQSFTPRERHVGRLLRVQLSYVDGQGNLETILSPPSAGQNVNDKPNGARNRLAPPRKTHSSWIRA